jgi:hypothetical protein
MGRGEEILHENLPGTIAVLGEYAISTYGLCFDFGWCVGLFFLGVNKGGFMRRGGLLAIVLLLSICSASWADRGDLLPANELFQYVAQGQVHEAEDLLLTRSFSSWTLGRALLTMLDRSSSDRIGERNAYRLAQLLVAKGAEVNYADSAGRTPLMLACSKRHETVTQMLLEAGADIDAVDSARTTVDQYASMAGGDLAMIYWILSNAREKADFCRVSNVRVRLQGNRIVVSYDLDSKKPARVKLRASDNEGKSFRMDVRHVSGDVGKEIVPGDQKEIVWDATKDYPTGFGDVEVMLDVVVSSL